MKHGDVIHVTRLGDILPDLVKSRSIEQEIAILKIGQQEIKSRLHVLETRRGEIE